MAIQKRIKAVLDRAVLDIDQGLTMGQPKVKVIFGRNADNFRRLARDYVALRSAETRRQLTESYGLFAEGTREAGVLPIRGFGKKSVLDLLETMLIDLAECYNGRCLLADVVGAMLPGFRILLGNRREGDAYSPTDDTLYINPFGAIAAWRTDSDGQRMCLFQIYNLGHGIVEQDEFFLPEPLIESRLGLSPMWLSLHHELIHMLDRRVKNRVQLCSRLQGEYGPAESHDRVCCLVDVREDRRVIEHRAVLDISPGVYSDVASRLECGQPFRYMYQSADEFSALYEPLSCVLKMAAKLFRLERGPVLQPSDQEFFRAYMDRIVESFERLPRVRRFRTPSLVYMKIRLAPLFREAWKEFINGSFDVHVEDALGVREGAIARYKGLALAARTFVKHRMSQARVREVMTAIEATRGRHRLVPKHLRLVRELERLRSLGVLARDGRVNEREPDERDMAMVIGVFTPPGTVARGARQRSPSPTQCLVALRNLDWLK